MAQAEIMYNQGEKAEALKYFIKGLKSYNEIYQKETETMIEGQEVELNKSSMKKRSIIRKIIRILSSIPEKKMFNPLSKAIELAKHFNFTHETCVLYEKALEAC